MYSIHVVVAFFKKNVTFSDRNSLVVFFYFFFLLVLVLHCLCVYFILFLVPSFSVYRYTFMRPDCGYVQGMSYLAAILLLFLDTYPAFQALANMMAADASSLLQLYKMNSAHNRTMFTMFDKCFQEILPKVTQSQVLLCNMIDCSF